MFAYAWHSDYMFSVQQLLRLLPLELTSDWTKSDALLGGIFRFPAVSGVR